MYNTSEWPIWWHHMVGHEGCSSFAELSRNKIFKATQYSHIWLYSEETFFFLMLQFPQLFFHLKPETNVIFWLKFWRINKQPLLELQSQLKLLGHFSVSLPSHCWCARFGELPAINNIERTRRRARSKKTGWKCPNYFCLRLILL